MSTAERPQQGSDRSETPDTFGHYYLDSRDPLQVSAGLSLIGLQRRLDARHAPHIPASQVQAATPPAEISLPLQRDDEGMVAAPATSLETQVIEQ